ncbi:MAG: ATP-binding protein [Candidatus Hodarchaeales archaeon]
MEELKLFISSQEQIINFGSKVGVFAKKLGFSQKEIAEILIILYELGSNLIKHRTLNGFLKVVTLSEKKGLRIIAKDNGPGIENVDMVEIDGFSSIKSLGIGLGAIKRLSDKYEISTHTHSENIGTTIMVEKYVVGDSSPENEKIELSVFTRSKEGNLFNGDTYFIRNTELLSVLSIIDGVGHGLEASEASQKALLYVEGHYTNNLESIIFELDKELKGTRGVAISILAIKWEENVIEYLGVGNVLTRIITVNPLSRQVKSKLVLNYDGILGFNMKKYSVITLPFEKRDIIIMTSDGLSSRYTALFEEEPDLIFSNTANIAYKIFDRYQKLYDDATIIVGKIQ